MNQEKSRLERGAMVAVTEALLAGMILLILSSSPALAEGTQDEERQSHFGVIANFGLPSEFRDEFGVLLDTDHADIRSRDVEVGFIVRGRQLGGDWGVSYIQ